MAILKQSSSSFAKYLVWCGVCDSGNSTENASAQYKFTEYVNEFEVLKEQNQFGIQEYINIQHYAPKQGYHAWHSERAGVGIANTRLLAFMTYLNDVENGGETSWLYQNLKIKPERGLTVIWPADWTHTHRGITAPNEHKYITTGWLNYWNIVDENSSIK